LSNEKDKEEDSLVIPLNNDNNEANKQIQATLDTDRDIANLPTEPYHQFTERKPFTIDEGQEPLRLSQVLLEAK